MRLALQALFLAPEADGDGATRRALLERRLRSSERSAGFFRRLRDVVDDVSMQAPEIFAEESFPDANVVAEYLDSQTSLEIARDYEDVCWGSPEALAEVGRCYDILNNEALNCVVVPKNCRRRLYYIAWEENSVNLASESESAAIDLTSSESFESDELERKSAEEGSAAERVVSKAKKKREKKKASSAETVGSTLAAERSLWRRAKRWTTRTALALGLGGAIYCGWQTLNVDKSSETLQLETPQAELEVANITPETNDAEEGPLRPTAISGPEFDELPAISLSESASASEDVALDDFETLNAETEPLKVAVLPDVPSELGESRSDFAKATNAEGSRFGLESDEPWTRRPSIEIPAQNNDVFSKTKRY